MGIRWQFIENQVPDPFNGIPIGRGKRGYIYLRKCMEKLPKSWTGAEAHSCCSMLKEDDSGTHNQRTKGYFNLSWKDLFCDNTREFLKFGLRS